MEALERLKSALADRYAVERQIGAIGMADVNLTHDLRHNRKVAIKVMHRDLAELVGVERFLREIETTAKLQHPHIHDARLPPPTRQLGQQKPLTVVVLNWFDELRARVPR